MVNQLLENYKGRLSVSEKYYSQVTGGQRMSAESKLNTAVCLHNVAKFMNESFDSSVGTQRADLGKFKRFCLL